MAQRPKAAVSLPSSPHRTAHVSAKGRLWQWGRLLRDPLLPLLLTGMLVIAFLAYQPRFHLAGKLTDQPNHIRLVGVYSTEGQGAIAQRWTAPQATLRFVGVGAGNYTVLLRFHGGAQAGAGRSLMVTATSSDPLPLAQFPVRPDWQEVALFIPSAAVDPASGDLALTLEIAPMRGSAADPRSLGVALAQVVVAPARTDGGMHLPPWWRTVQLLLIAALSYMALRLVAVSSALAATLAGVIGIIWGLAIVSARLDAVLLLDIAQRVLPWTVAIAALLRLVPYTIARIRQLPTANCQLPTAVSCAVLLIFALRFGGLLHPQYIMIDQKLRANQLVNIAAGRADLVLPQLEQQYEWGTREPVPYSLLTYDILVPLTWFWKDDDLLKAIAATSALLDATVPVLLWLLLQRPRTDDRGPRIHAGFGRSPHLSASFAALCYAAFPIGYLFFHDGSFPTTIGLWFVLVALVAVRWLVDIRQGDRETGRQGDARRNQLAVGSWQLAVGRWQYSMTFVFRLSSFVFTTLTLSIALTAYVTHLAFAPFLVGALAASFWLIGRDRAAARRIALALMLAGASAWLVYYRDYTVALVQRTIPAFVQRIAEQGSVGRDTGLLYATAVNSPWQHFQFHFRVWPVVIGAMALALLLTLRPRRFVTHLGLAYGVFIGATLVAEHWFGLWNKHMAFAAPGVALLAGVGLAFMWRRGPVGRLICIILIGFLLWESTTAWGNRVLWYILPASAL